MPTHTPASIHRVANPRAPHASHSQPHSPDRPHSGHIAQGATEQGTAPSHPAGWWEQEWAQSPSGCRIREPRALSWAQGRGHRELVTAASWGLLAQKDEQSSLLLPPKDNCVRERAGQHSRAGGWGEGRGPGPETPGRRTRDRTWQRKAAWAPRVQTPAQQRQEAGAAVRVQWSAPSCSRATQVCARESSLPGDRKEQLKSRLPK